MFLNSPDQTIITHTVKYYHALSRHGDCSKYNQKMAALDLKKNKKLNHTRNLLKHSRCLELKAINCNCLNYCFVLYLSHSG